MSGQIKEVLERNVPISITPALATAIIKLVNAYESRETHPEAFSSPYLGLKPCFFLTKDRDDFFALFNADAKEVINFINQYTNGRNTIFGITTTSLIDTMKNLFGLITKEANLMGITAGEMRKHISEMSSVDANYKVVSDPLNIFITYVMHKVAISDIPNKQKEETIFKLVMYLQYKFFTSLVNHRFKYRPSEEVMSAMYESLTMKFDLKQYGTWKKVMEVRAESFIKPDSIHYKTLQSYDSDKAILYLITDIQTRIRNQINIVTQEFMKVKENKDRIGSYSNVGTDIDGEKVVVDNESCFDMMVANIYNDSMSVSRFLDNKALQITANLFTSLNITKVRQFMIAFSEYAVKQFKSGKSELIKEENGRVLFIGAKVLLHNLIQKSYRYCINMNVNIKQPSQIIKAVKDVYSSSRISDEGIIQVRESVGKLVEEIGNTQRDATISSLKIGFCLYIIILSFKYLK